LGVRVVMGGFAGTETDSKEPEVLRALLQVGVNLSAIEDRQQMLSMILQEVRRLARAEAGSLYILHKGKLRLAVAQNDRIVSKQIESLLLNREFPLTNDSLVGFVACTGEVMNIANSYVLPPGAPFRIDREVDATTGYRAKSILAIPLQCPDGKCIGVLELFNRLNEQGKAEPFPEAQCHGVLSLASMAAVTIHNAVLQEELRKAHLDAIIRLSVAAELRNDETGAHLRRISHTAGLIAQAMGLSEKEIELVRSASPMHDVGKIGIPDSVLCKPGSLSASERKTVQGHCLMGAEILGDPLNELVAAARVVAVTHHERWDGQGYPNGLAGEEIPLYGRIVGLADVFDALVSKRCYKEARPLEEALDVIRSEKGKHFDPKVVDAFFQVLDEVAEFYRDPANRDDVDGQ